MAKVRLRPAASADLADILSYSRAQFGAKAAERYVARLRSAFAFLEQHSNATPLLDWLDPSARSYVAGRHRILFEVDGDTIWIGRILHVARDLSDWSNA